jgi:integrase
MKSSNRPDFFTAKWDDQNPRVNLSTHIHYMQIANRLVRRFHVETGCDLALDGADAFTPWLKDLMAEVRSKTREVYRAALRYAASLEGEELDLSVTWQPRSEKNTKLPAHQAEDAHPTAQRRKSPSSEDIQRMLDDVYRCKKMGTGYKRNEHIAVLMLALSAQTGLRPIEWLDARHDSAAGLLVIRNAKHSVSKSFGEYRTLDIQGLDAEWVAAMDYLLEKVAKYRSDRTPRHIQMDYTLRLGKACKAVYDRAFPRRGADYPRITLYSGRHMFAAAAKADPDITDVELSAMMGHRSLVTVHENYAFAKRKGGSGIKVRASAADIKAVKAAQVRATGAGMKL